MERLSKGGNMPKTRKSSSPTITKPRTAGTYPTTEEIALRAYQIFLERGGAPGNALEDWTRAERELIENGSKPRRKPAPKSIAA
jgi:hypothetical protein